jgi:hypothetical protein
MSQRMVTSCQITSFYISDPPFDGVTGPHQWMAIATAHVYDESPDTRGILSHDQAILAGAVMKVVEARTTANTEENAMKSVVGALLFQLEGLRGQRRSILE